MRLSLLLAAFLTLPVSAQGPSASDIWLADVTPRGNAMTLTNIRRVTERPGYDNQPRFTEDGRSLYYTSYRNGQSDIWRFDISVGRHTQLTRSPESEYSATPLPDGSGRVAVVRVERDSTQRIWSFAPDGGDPELYIPNLPGVGYYAWMPGTYLVAFIVADTNRLELVDLTTMSRHVITYNTGTTFQTLPEGPALLYAARDGDLYQLIAWSPAAPDQPLALGLLPSGPHFVMTPSRDWVFAADGDGIRALHTLNPEQSYQLVQGLAGRGFRGITRLALSPDGRQLAFVAAEPE
ncbi:MAG: hypothetical protein WD934_06835 [Gemmatimonadales bacterium]